MRPPRPPRRGTRQARAAGNVGSIAAPEVSLRASSAKPTSRAVWKRSAGSFSRHRRTMRSSAGGTAALTRSMGAGSRAGSRRACRPASARRRADGRASISYRTVPRAKTSLRASAAVAEPARATCRRSFRGGSRAGEPLRLRARVAAKVDRQRLDDVSQAEVEDLGPSVLGQEDVGRLEVAVHDPLVVRGREPARELHRDLHGLAQGRARPSCSRSCSVLPLEQLGHEVGRAFVRSHVVDGQHVRVVQGAGGPRFPLEALHALRVPARRRAAP